MKKIVYITGCLGFIGSHLTRQLLESGFYVYGVDKETYAANMSVLDEFSKYKNFRYIHADINDLERLADCDYVINAAAESHVDNSIASSDVFLRSNVSGVHHLLSLIKNKSGYTRPIFLHFSTDEVYGDIVSGFHKESDPLIPSNPYSATKAAADMLVLAWARTHNLPYVIMRPTNNYGTHQYAEKLIPKSIKYLELARKIELHDGGTPRRTWLHVSDTVRAVRTIIELGVTNEIYNISGNYEEANAVVVTKILSEYGAVGTLTNHTINLQRPGQDVRYAIDDSKLRALGWSAQANFDIELKKIVKFYRNNFVW